MDGHNAIFYRQGSLAIAGFTDMKHGAVRGKFSSVDTVRKLCFVLRRLRADSFRRFRALCRCYGAFLCGKRAFCRCRIRCLTGTTAAKQQTGTQSAHDYDFIH